MSFQIEPQGSYSYTIHPTYGQTCLVHAKDIEEMREHFRRERDTELGRWRHPDHPDYVVYPQARREDNPRCLVLHEPTGETNLTTWRQVTSDIISVSQFEIVARDYFLAHEEPKPWHEAKPGEIWDVTTKNTLGTVQTQRCQVIRNLRFLPFMEHSGFQNPSIDLKNTQIQDATRVLEAFEADRED